MRKSAHRKPNGGLHGRETAARRARGTARPAGARGPLVAGAWLAPLAPFARRMPGFLGRSLAFASQPGAFKLRQGAKWLLLSSLVGVVAGLGAVAFKYMFDAVLAVTWGEVIGILPRAPQGEPEAFAIHARGSLTLWALVAMPALGGLLSGLIVSRLAPEAEGHGTDSAIDAFHRNQGIIRRRIPFVKGVASAITIGSGGSGGREGPIAQIGAGFGSMLADVFHLGAKGRRVLLAAGIGAGVGAIFRAPLAGAVFAAEVLYRDEDIETDVLLPATIAAIISYSVFGAWFGFGHLFAGTSDLAFTGPLELLPYLVLALVSVGAAGIYTETFYGLEAFWHRLPLPAWLRPGIGGAAAGALGLVLYLATDDRTVLSVLGSGYGVLEEAMTSDAASTGIGILLLVAFGKIVATSFSIGSGGSGGVFGPSMVIGGTLGGVVGKAFHALSPTLAPHPGAFVVVGMAGFFTAAANTPISTVIMVSELTGNYQLLIPSMWVAALAMLLGRRFSIYRSQLPNRFHSPAHMGAQVTTMALRTTVEAVYKKRRRVQTVRADATLSQMVALVDESHQRLFPVVDEADLLIGAFRIEDLTHALEGTGVKGGIIAADLMERYGKAPTVLPGDPLDRAMGIVCTGLREEVLVVDPADPRKLLGMLTRADVLVGYSRAVARNAVVRDTEE